jgi:hypothetical protein
MNASKELIKYWAYLCESEEYNDYNKYNELMDDLSEDTWEKKV